MSNRSRPRSVARHRVALLLAAVLPGCLGWTRDPDGRPEYLTDYIDAHYRDLGRTFVAPVSRTELEKRLAGVRILFLGDHHRDAELHGQMLALIRWLCDAGHRPVLGIEAVGIQDDAALQEYLAGDISMPTLRRRIADRWPGSWLDNPAVDAGFFRDLLRIARTRKLTTFTLEPTPRLPLDERDSKIARNIRRAERLYPDRLIVVVVGHAHLFGQGHLSGRVGAPNVAIAPRFSSRLEAKLPGLAPLPPSSFLCSDRGVLFFPPPALFSE